MIEYIPGQLPSPLVEDELDGFNMVTAAVA
jgi:hypothetical protein